MSRIAYFGSFTLLATPSRLVRLPLSLVLPVEFGLVAEFLACLFNADERMPRVLVDWVVRNVGEYLLDELGRGRDERRVGVGNVVDVVTCCG